MAARRSPDGGGKVRCRIAARSREAACQDRRRRRRCQLRSGRSSTIVAGESVPPATLALLGLIAAGIVLAAIAPSRPRAGETPRPTAAALLALGAAIAIGWSLYAIGRVNFLSDPNQKPHLRTDELAELLGVKQATMANKGRLIMDTIRIGLMDPEYSRRDMLDNNPMVWLLQVDGLLVDARHLPEALQVQAWRRGLIPYVPAQATGDRAGTSTADRP